MTSRDDLRRMAGALCALLALAVYSSTAAAQAGYVHDVSGNASIRSAQEKARPAKAGDKFDSGTLLRTGMGAKVILKFADGQIIALSPDSSLRIGQYRYSADSLGQSASTVELTRGQMRFVTGLIGTANREAVRIIVGNSMISIRKPGGADFTVSITPEPQEIGYTVVAKGEISVRTPYGLITRVADNQYAPWRPGQAQPLPLPIAAAPAVVQAATAALWAAVLPTDTPVAVAAAARTAAASAAPGPAVAAVGPATADTGADAKAVGYVQEISNGVSVRTASGATAAASAGMTFDAGTTFDTGIKGRAALKFADGQLVILGPSSVLAVSQYEFDPSNVTSGSVSVNLVDGAMRVITGVIHAENPTGVSVSAGASIIDILNTGPSDFTVVVDTRDQEVGVARVTTGEISVHTPYGPIDKIAADKSSLWGPRKTPETPIPVATALSVVQAAVALQLSGLPDNAPVAVEPSARAAAAVAQAAQAQAAAAAAPQSASLQAAAQVATEMAALATEAATIANEAIAAKIIATKLDTLPPKAAGPALAQAPGEAPAFPTALPPAPIAPAVTPGAGGGCKGSVC